MTAPHPPGALLLLCAGLFIWSAAFISLYAALSPSCAFGWENLPFSPLSLRREVLVGLCLAHPAALLMLLL
jgi:hypothetical protein